MSGIKKIQANCHIFQVSVVCATGNELELDWTDTTKRTLKVSPKDNVLEIGNKASVSLYGYGPLALIDLKRDSELLIKVPECYTGKLIVQSETKKILVSGLHLSGDLGLAASTGEIGLEDVRANLIDIRGNAGRVSCTGIDAGQISIGTSHGDVSCSINAAEADYRVFCESMRRDVYLPESAGEGPKSIRITTKMGRISLTFQPGVTRAPSDRPVGRKDAFQDW